MLDDIKQFAGKFAPPSALSLAFSAMIYAVPNQTLLTWPFLGEFVMDSALKAVMMAAVWFLVFSGWAFWKLVNPSYRDSVYDDVANIRDMLAVFRPDKNLNIDKWSELSTTLRQSKVKIPKQLGRIEILDVCETVASCGILKFQGLEEPLIEQIEILEGQIIKFISKTDWVLKK